MVENPLWSLGRLMRGSLREAQRIITNETLVESDLWGISRELSMSMPQVLGSHCHTDLGYSIIVYSED